MGIEAAGHASILWRRLDLPGHEASRVRPIGDMWELAGSAVFVDDSQPVRLDYRVVCDEAWNSRSASVTGWVGAADVDVAIALGSDGVWICNGVPQPQLAGCIDVDLEFSPSTNLLPIRRLQLGVGEEALVRAAWLRFPSFALEVLEQRYRRLTPDTYQYESGSFTAQIHVNELGLPLEYAGGWAAVDGTTSTSRCPSDSDRSTY